MNKFLEKISIKAILENEQLQIFIIKLVSATASAAAEGFARGLVQEYKNK